MPPNPKMPFHMCTPTSKPPLTLSPTSQGKRLVGRRPHALTSGLRAQPYLQAAVSYHAIHIPLKYVFWWVAWYVHRWLNMPRNTFMSPCMHDLCSFQAVLEDARGGGPHGCETDPRHPEYYPPKNPLFFAPLGI